MNNRIVLLTPMTSGEVERLGACFGNDVGLDIVSDLAGLRAAKFDRGTTLLSFGSGVIVPRDVLARLSRPAYNLHAASPDFPGRDPHHHAIYRSATEYGATLHVMTERVDDGPIIGVESFPIAPGTSPAQLLAQANEAGFRLLQRLGPRLLEPVAPPPLPGVMWGKRKTSRNDFHQMCKLSPLITEDELDHRFRAFDGASHDNLTLELHGHLFRIDKSRAPVVKTGSFDEFTEAGFRGLLRGLKANGYRFARYGDGGADRHVIWRHDVDFSMHRAARLAEIESAEGATATYFVNPRCTFYNLLEPEIGRLLDRIRALGHEIGLHFDAGAYGIVNWTEDQIEEALARERAILELILAAPVNAVSWHNPDMSNLLDFDDDEIGGLVSAYGRSLRRDYTYCSDSNGYWRFKPMSEAIAAGHQRLHLLTHPAWWVAEAMSPSARIDRAILGRARAVRRDYDAFLARANRKNIVAPE
jgi:hypothetical protein